ncbi:MAG: MFS transporter [Promethearchaeota archaeon]
MEEKIIIPVEKVPRKSKIAFSFGGLANDILNGFVFSNITFYYNAKLGLDATLLGIAWLIFAIWNTLNDPIISYIIDNTRTRLGRRIPYIRYGSFLYGAAFIFCWFPIAPIGNDIGLFFNFLAALFILDTAFTFIGCCFFSLPNEIAITAKQRGSIVVYRTIIGFINTILGLILPIMLLTGHEGIPDIFYIAIIIIGIICSLLLYGTSYYYKENIFAQLQPHEPFIEGLRLTLKNKSFWIYAIPAFLITLVYPVFSTGLLYYVDYVVIGQDIMVFLIIFLLSVIGGSLFFPRKIMTWGGKRLMMYSLLMIAIGFGILFFVGRNAMLAIIPFIIVGFFFAGASISNGILIGDVIDNDELITGKRREAIYGGVNAIITKPAISLANWFFLSILTLFNFQEPIIVNGVAVKQPQTMMGITGILVAFCILPAFFLSLGALALRWFPLEGPEWLKKKAYLMKLHEQKEREYLEKIAEKNKNISSNEEKE